MKPSKASLALAKKIEDIYFRGDGFSIEQLAIAIDEDKKDLVEAAALFANSATWKSPSPRHFMRESGKMGEELNKAISKHLPEWE